MKPKKKKKAKKKSDGSLLSRLFGGAGGKAKDRKKTGRKDAGKKKGKTAVGKETAPDGAASGSRPMTRLERSIAEIRQMTRIGQKDPERLAQLLARLLAKEREKQQADRERFEAQVWEIVRRSERAGDEEREGSGDPPPEPS